MQSSSPVSLLALLVGPLTTNPAGLTCNPVVISTLKIWFQFRKRFKFTSPAVLTPLLKNPVFKPAITNSTFSLWQNKGLICFKDFYRERVFCSFADLFRYFQVRNCAKSLFFNFPQLPPEQPWGEPLLLNPLNKSVISKIYNFIQSNDGY